MVLTPQAIADTLSPELNDEIFDLLRGHERGAVPSAVDHAYEMIWKRLMSAGGRESQRLSDVALAAQLGVSRTPVRQALYRLAEHGLVVSDPRRGFWVRRFTARDVHDVYVLRGTLEALAVRLAAPRLNPEELLAQRATVRRLAAAVDSFPIADHLRSDISLHNLTILNSGNQPLIRALAALRSQHSMFQVHDSSYPIRVDIAGRDHDHILSALINADGEGAAVLMARHIENAEAGVLADLFPYEDVNT